MNSFFQPPQNNTNATSGSNAPAGGGIFGNQPGNAAGTTGTSTSIFGQAPNPGTKMSSGGTSSGLFGGGSTTNTTPSGTGGNIFSGGGNAGSGLFGGGNTSTPSNSLMAGGSSNTNIFGGGAFNTGGSTTAFGDGSKSGDQGSTSAPKPAMPSFFSNPSGTSTVPASGSTPALGGGLFGSSATKPADSTPASSVGTNPQAGSGLFGGGLFGKKPEDQATPNPATPGVSATPKSFFNLGGSSDASKDSAPAAPSSGLFNLGGTTKPPEKSSTTAPTFNLFGGAKDASAEKKDASTAPASFGIFSAAKDASVEKKDTPAAPALFGLTKEPSTDKKDVSSTLGLGQPSTSKEGDKPQDALASASNGPLATTTVSTNISVPPPSMLRGKTIEEIVNRWSADLETHVREFNKFAGEVAVWDRALIENGNNLAALYSHVLAAEREQNDIDQSLDHIEQQQKDLSTTLDAYEKSTEEILGDQGGSLRALDTGPADNERDKNYMLATELHTHLDDLSGSLTQMIDSVNALSLSSPGSGDAKSQQGEDAMAQIAQILSSHLESLQWIDGAVREVESKVTEVEKGVRDAGVNNLGGGNKSRGFGLNR